MRINTASRLKFVVGALGLVLLAACGGSAPVATPTLEPVLAPTATVTSTSASTDTPLPSPTDTLSTEQAATGFADLVACLEDTLGTEVAQTLVSGERQETTAEKVVVEGCLLVTASGISSQDLSPAVTACLEEGLGAGVVAVVGSGARSLTADEEGVLLDCLVSSALAPAEPEPVSALEACLADRLGAEIAALVASEAVPPDEVEQAALNECRLVSALSPAEEGPKDSLTACLEQSLGPEVAAVVASRAVPPTEEEAAVLGDCLLRTGVEEAPQTQDQSVTACLAERLGEDIAAVVASGLVPLNDAEQEVLGECLLSSSLNTTNTTSDTSSPSDTASQSITACVAERLGPEIAAVVVSGAIPLTEEEAEVMGDCLLLEALGGSP